MLSGRSEAAGDHVVANRALNITPIRAPGLDARVHIERIRRLTNGGIADELFISTKTASGHVSNILAKLNMASRSEIAVWVTGGGLG